MSLSLLHKVNRIVQNYNPSQPRDGEGKFSSGGSGGGGGGGSAGGGHGNKTALVSAADKAEAEIPENPTTADLRVAADARHKAWVAHYKTDGPDAPATVEQRNKLSAINERVARSDKQDVRKATKERSSKKKPEEAPQDESKKYRGMSYDQAMKRKEEESLPPADRKIAELERSRTALRKKILDTPTKEQRAEQKKLTDEINRIKGNKHSYNAIHQSIHGQTNNSLFRRVLELVTLNYNPSQPRDNEGKFSGGGSGGGSGGKSNRQAGGAAGVSKLAESATARADTKDPGTPEFQKAHKEAADMHNLAAKEHAAKGNAGKAMEHEIQAEHHAIHAEQPVRSSAPKPAPTNYGMEDVSTPSRAEQKTRKYEAEKAAQARETSRDAEEVASLMKPGFSKQQDAMTAEQRSSHKREMADYISKRNAGRLPEQLAEKVPHLGNKHLAHLKEAPVSKVLIDQSARELGASFTVSETRASSGRLVGGNPLQNKIRVGTEHTIRHYDPQKIVGELAGKIARGNRHKEMTMVKESKKEKGGFRFTVTDTFGDYEHFDVLPSRPVTNEGVEIDEELAVNLSGKLRRETLHGKTYLVAPMRMIVPGVLNGSKGPILYTSEENVKNFTAWNNMPIVVNHPMDLGRPVSARSPKVLEKHGIGFVFNSVAGKYLDAEGWFDVEATRRIEPRILDSLEAGRPIELSTGLFMDYDPAPENAVFNGVSYKFIARNYRPDHLAVLPDQTGACSLSDGCGVLVNKKNKLTVRGLLTQIAEVIANYNPSQPRDAQGRFSGGGSGGGGGGKGKSAGRGKGGGKSLQQENDERTQAYERGDSAAMEQAAAEHAAENDPGLHPSSRVNQAVDSDYAAHGENAGMAIPNEAPAGAKSPRDSRKKTSPQATPESARAASNDANTLSQKAADGESYQDHSDAGEAHADAARQHRSLGNTGAAAMHEEEAAYHNKMKDKLWNQQVGDKNRSDSSNFGGRESAVKGMSLREFDQIQQQRQSARKEREAKASAAYSRKMFGGGPATNSLVRRVLNILTLNYNPSQPRDNQGRWSGGGSGGGSSSGKSGMSVSQISSTMKGYQITVRDLEKGIHDHIEFRKSPTTNKLVNRVASILVAQRRP